MVGHDPLLPDAPLDLPPGRLILFHRKREFLGGDGAAMKTSLEHLPDVKLDELKIVVEQILAEFKDEVGMIILFGSYARGDWLEEFAPDRLRYQYQSDFDIMVVTRKSHRHTHRWAQVERAVEGKGVSTRLELEHTNIGFFNKMLELGYYFYVDMVEEGVMLHDSGRLTLSEPRVLTPEEAYDKAKVFHDEWLESGVDFHEAFQHAFSLGKLKLAAFLLHQATEHLLTAFLLVRTDYKPKLHDLDKLMALAAARDVEMLKVFPKGTELEEKRFKLLRDAYVGARYESSYHITREDLDYLAPRVEFLLDLVRQRCLGRLAHLKARRDEPERSQP